MVGRDGNGKALLLKLGLDGTLIEELRAAGFLGTGGATFCEEVVDKVEVAFCPGFGEIGKAGLLTLTRLKVDGNDEVEPERSKGGGSFRRIPSTGP